MGRELIFTPAGFFARGAGAACCAGSASSAHQPFPHALQFPNPAQSLLFTSAEVSMGGDTRLWPSLIALTFVAVSGLSVSDGRETATPLRHLL